jgi:tetratricopeptide (TPR) repeat protein
MNIENELKLQPGAVATTPSADDFESLPQTPDKAGKLLARYCPPGMEKTLHSLAATRSFDRELFFFLAETLGYPATAASFELLTGLSFVERERGQARELFRLHRSVQRVLEESDADETMQAHRVLLAYYLEKNRAENELSLTEAIYHANRCDGQDGFSRWTSAMEEALVNRRRTLAEALLSLSSELRLKSDYAQGKVNYYTGAFNASMARNAEARQNFAAAIRCYSQALQDAPDDLYAYNNMGNAQQGLAKLLVGSGAQRDAREAYAAAIETYGQTLRRAPDDVYAHNNKGIAQQGLAELLIRMGAYQDARETYAAAIASYDLALMCAPNDFYAYSNKGIALRGLAEFLTGSGEQEEARNAYEAAIAAYNQALRHAPDSVCACYNKGNAQRGLAGLMAGMNARRDARETYAAAIESFDQALRRASDDVYAHNNKGIALRGLAELLSNSGEYEGARKTYTAAIESLDQALQRAPDDAKVIHNKQQTLKKLAALNP